MNQQISEFLTAHHICSFTSLLKDGSPHSAALHFSHKEEPVEFYFSTDRNSRKCQALIEAGASKASVVVGLSEKEWVTMQLDGDVYTVTDPAELAEIHKIHYAKHPGSEKWKDDPDTIFMRFVPNWWRYTDFNTKPPTILSSEEA